MIAFFIYAVVWLFLSLCIGAALVHMGALELLAAMGLHEDVLAYPASILAIFPTIGLMWITEKWG